MRGAKGKVDSGGISNFLFRPMLFKGQYMIGHQAWERAARVSTTYLLSKLFPKTTQQNFSARPHDTGLALIGVPSPNV
jgi:hypothetical protein